MKRRSSIGGGVGAGVGAAVGCCAEGPLRRRAPPGGMSPVRDVASKSPYATRIRTQGEGPQFPGTVIGSSARRLRRGSRRIRHGRLRPRSPGSSPGTIPRSRGSPARPAPCCERDFRRPSSSSTTTTSSWRSASARPNAPRIASSRSPSLRRASRCRSIGERRCQIPMGSCSAPAIRTVSCVSSLPPRSRPDPWRRSYARLSRRPGPRFPKRGAATPSSSRSPQSSAPVGRSGRRVMRDVEDA